MSLGSGPPVSGGPPPATCEVWLSWLRPPEPAELSWLTASERARAESFQHRSDRWRSAGGAVLLRRAVAAATSLAPEEVVVARRCPMGHTDHGRPSLPGIWFHVSLSHAGDLLAVALTSDQPVGIDVEPAGRELEPGLLDLVRHPDDDAVDSPAALLVSWVRKEAVVKATGEGLSRPLTTVRLTSVEHPAWHLDDGPGGHVVDLPLPAGYVGAVAAEGPPLTLRLRWLTP